MTKIRQSASRINLTSAIGQYNDLQNEVHFWWLGQAGFALRYSNCLLLIDPYLSDSLAKKYKNSEFKHQRMMPIPIAPETITDCTWCLCTHGHTDHMDAVTIHGLVQGSNPAFLLPRAEMVRGKERGMPPNKMQGINTGELVYLDSEISVEAIASAHEKREFDTSGNDKFLGYVITLGNVRIYHSGDTVPYDGLEAVLLQKNIDIAMLPINGRDTYRLSKGIPGNLTLPEAIQLCHAANIHHLIGHHFEMFSFNTQDRQQAQAILQQQAGTLNWLLPEIGTTYTFKKQKAVQIT